MLRNLEKLIPVSLGVTSKLTLTWSYPGNLLTDFINAFAIGIPSRSSPTMIIILSYRGARPGIGCINSCLIFCISVPPACVTALIWLAYSGYNLCHVCTLTFGGIGSSLPTALPINKYGSPPTDAAFFIV